MIAECKNTAAGPELFVCGVKVATGLGVDRDSEFKQLARLVNQGFQKKYCARAIITQGLWICAEQP